MGTGAPGRRGWGRLGRQMGTGAPGRRAGGRAGSAPESGSELSGIRAKAWRNPGTARGAAPCGTAPHKKATPTGLEPATSAVTGRRANQLRYGALLVVRVVTVLRIPNGIRTRAAAVKGRSPRPLDDGDLPDLFRLGRRNYMGVSGAAKSASAQSSDPAGSTLRPGPHVVDRPRRDDALGGDAEALGALAAERLHVELTGRVRVGVDGEEAAEVAGQLDELVGRVAAARDGS